jgi:hypothetical protein
VGLVGNFNSDKTTLTKFLSYIRIIKNINLVVLKIGLRTRDEELINLLTAEGVEFCYTSSSAEYINFLKSLSIGVVLAKKERYYFRNSGTIADMAASGVVVICPDFPVFRSQIENPVTIGALYSSELDVDKAILKVLSDLVGIRDNLKLYNKFRIENNEFKTFDY